MPLIYITGPSGSGKSAIMRELQARGYEAHGVDEYGFADWVDRKTGKIADFPHEGKNLDFHDWYQKHAWVLSKERIGKLKQQADTDDKPVFLCGVADGEDKVWHHFNKVIALVVDEQTIRRRIAAREDNQFGKTEAEMADTLKWLKGYEQNYRKFGAIIVDATKPLNEVVNEILRQTGGES